MAINLGTGEKRRGYPSARTGNNIESPYHKNYPSRDQLLEADFAIEDSRSGVGLKKELRQRPISLAKQAEKEQLVILATSSMDEIATSYVL